MNDFPSDDLGRDLMSDKDMDVNIPFDEMDESEVKDIEGILDRLMVGLSHLWRHGKSSAVEFSNKVSSIVKPDAYFKRDDEDSLSVFDLIDALKVFDKSNIQVEADRFIIAMGAEVLCTANSSIPIALFKSNLLDTVSRSDNNVRVIRDIVQSDQKKYDFALSYHWDINLPESDSDRQLLYGVLAMSSIAYKNEVSSHRKISSDLNLKREDKRKKSEVEVEVDVGK